MSPDAEATFHRASCTPGNQVIRASDGSPLRQERRPTRVCRTPGAGSGLFAEARTLRAGVIVSWVATASLSTVESSARRVLPASSPHRATPATVYQARPKANPGPAPTPTTASAPTAPITAPSLCVWPAARTTSASAEPTPNPRPDPCPRPQHQNHQSHHGRTAPRSDPRRHLRLPTHRRPKRPQTEKTPNPMRVQGYSTAGNHDRPARPRGTRRLICIAVTRRGVSGWR